MRALIVAISLLWFGVAYAQPAPSGIDGGYWAGGGCKLVTFSGSNGARAMMVDQNGNLCVNSGGGSSSTPTYTKPSPYTSAGTSQTLTVTTSAQPLPMIPAGALYAELTISGAPVVWRDDGTPPVGTGVQQWSSGSITTYAVTPLTNLQLILPTGGATATVGVAYYK